MTESQRFAQLFAGNTSAIGLLGGGCQRELVNELSYRRHLFAPGQSIGIYPIVDNAVHWGCSDIDNAENHKVGHADPRTDAINVQTALQALGIPSLIELTKSRGYHVWVFLAPGVWVRAATMRRALLVAHQIAGVVAHEVNPKSEELRPGELGNYVNLPYPHDWSVVLTRVVENHHTAKWAPFATLEQFLDLAEASYADPAALAAAAELWVPPVRHVVKIESQYDGDLRPLVQRMDGLTYTIFKDGPLDGRPRWMALSRLANLLREQEFTPEEAMALLTDADARWGKFQPEGRRDWESRLLRIVEEAYGKEPA